MPHRRKGKKKDLKSAQLTLEPFIPGGFMYHWLKYVELMSPDMFRNNVFAVKVAGALLLNAASKMYLIDYRLPPATIFAVLIGDTRTGKGTLMRYIRDVVHDANVFFLKEPFIRIIGNTTAEGLRDELANKVWIKKKREWQDRGPAKVVIQLWERAHSMVKSKWHASLPEVLDAAYYGDTIGQRRMTDLATVVAEEGTYYFSFLWDVHPPHWGSLVDFLKGEYGFLRRVLPIRFKGKLPLFAKYRPNPASARHRVEAAKILASFKDIGVAVELPEMPEVAEKIESLPFSDDVKSMIADYVKKLTAATLLDYVLSKVEDLESWLQRLQGYTVSSTGTSHHISLNISTIKSVTLVTRITNSNYCNFVTRTLEISCEGLKSLRSVTRPCNPVTTLALLWLDQIRNNIVFYTVSDTLVSEKMVRTEKFLEEKGGIATKKEWWLNVLGGVRKRVADELLQTLEALGVFKTWRMGRTTYLVAPWHKCCLNCKHLVFDYEERTYTCLKGHNLVSEMEMNLTKACKDFEPRGGEE